MVFRTNPPTPWQSVSAEGMAEGVQPFNGFSLEHVKGTKEGGSIFDIHGRIHTSVDLLAAGNLKRITVLLNATVQNVIFHDGGWVIVALYLLGTNAVGSWPKNHGN
ncbi:protein HOTHEAD-like [Magnolia sinica]|uniref:protein HOTHEAD-like n=1 Tax=Magnolia sinica TaxID=86752 RepID=UPI00265AB108|nr:protein HOTHEAD-like [Magnolia sinica]